MLKKEPLFDVEVILQAPEIRIMPTAHEIFSFIAQGARDCVEGYNLKTRNSKSSEKLVYLQ